MSDVAEAQEVAPEGSGESASADWKTGLSEELQRDPSIAHGRRGQDRHPRDTRHRRGMEPGLFKTWSS